ncbi:MAG: mRNA-decapping enzyme subunit 2 [Bogoriella megaspora]|nr:MAG: mRNA-decapping enzyme subunit 2 [Bogoriella megaspora]
MTETKMQLVDWLDDLCVRFIINLPQEELESVERICFQVEEAQWFYEDFIRPLDPTLPSLTLRNFCLRIFQHCPLLSQFSEYHHSAAFSEFLAYKTRVPVRGAIMLNDTMDKVVLVKGWKKNAAWSFPRGKINKDERDIDCAVREVYEETGYDIKEAGLVDELRETKSIEITMREQHMKLFVFRGVPMGTHFEPRTRKEISKIGWYNLADLPTFKKVKQPHDQAEEQLKLSKFYMVAPFLVPLKKWIAQQRKIDDKNQYRHEPDTSVLPYVEAASGDETARGTSAREEDRVQPHPSDIDRLLGSLRGSAPPLVSDNFPEILGPSENVQDPAAELKRMLSVGGPAMAERAIPQPANVQPSTASPTVSADLLSMLQGNSANLQRLHSTVPQTPAEQIIEAPAEPNSPMHPRPNVPLLDANQPAFTSPMPNANGPQASRLTQGGPTLQERLTSLQTAITNQNNLRNQGNNAGNANIRRDSLVFRPSQLLPSMPPPGPQRQPSQQVPRPYQRTGDPKFSDLHSFEKTNSPTVPPANKLPPPTLNSHTTSLLNAFKGTPSNQLVSPLEPHGPSMGFRAPEKMPSQVNPSSFNRPVAPVKLPQQSPSPALAVSPPFPATNGNSSSSPVPRDQARSTQQVTLLNLFRTPPANAPVPTSAIVKPSAAPEPVELAAQDAPVSSRQPKPIQILQRPKTRDVAEPKTIEETKSAPRPSHKASPSTGQISATVSGPLVTPDFSTLQKRESRIPTPNSAASNPTLPFVTSPHAAAPSTRSNQPEPIRAGPVAPRTQQPQPFQPTILQRPKQVSVAQTSPSSTAKPGSPFDRRDSLPQDQKSNLLALFGKTPASNGSPLASPPIPVSATSAGPARHISPAAMERSRLGSMTSVASAGGGVRSPIGADSGRQTPVTPKDREFLMGYLQGVVKGGK